MKSILDATMKDAAVIEARVLVSRLDGLAGDMFKGAIVEQNTIESLARQAVKLAELVDRIQEKPAGRRRGAK